MKTDKELLQIAKDIYHNKIFTSQQVNLRDEMGLVFMPLVFLKKKDLEKMRDDNVSFFFEYYDKAGSGSVNGYPIFMSVQMLNQEELNKMVDFHNKYKSANAEIDSSILKETK